VLCWWPTIERPDIEMRQVQHQRPRRDATCYQREVCSVFCDHFNVSRLVIALRVVACCLAQGSPLLLRRRHTLPILLPSTIRSVMIYWKSGAFPVRFSCVLCRQRALGSRLETRCSFKQTCSRYAQKYTDHSEASRLYIALCVAAFWFADVSSLLMCRRFISVRILRPFMNRTAMKEWVPGAIVVHIA
jgi:hypothetical protein